MILQFEIFYGDGSQVLGRTVQDWAKFPNDGVQVMIVLRDDNSREKFMGYDTYTHLGNDIVGDLGLRRAQHIKYASEIPDENWKRIIVNLETNSKLWAAPLVLEPKLRTNRNVRLR